MRVPTIFLGFIVAAVLAVAEKSSARDTVEAPQVTLNRVQEIFGLNLDTQDFTLKALLLAVAMDHTTADSPFAEEHIGIPFIVHYGPGYWVSRLKSGERRLEVLVNNALLLIFTKEDIPKKEIAIDRLMKLAASKGYWPADFFVADTTLTSQLTRVDGIYPTAIDDTTRFLAMDTMERLNHCAKLGFAPCQYRIGFWLANSPGSHTDGVTVLGRAIQTTQSDRRYNGVLDGYVVAAANQILAGGQALGVKAREQYLRLIEKYKLKMETTAGLGQL